MKVTGLAAGADQVVSVEWPTSLIPPETVMVSGSPVEWHPCLLVEITPHDGPLPTGNHVWDDNNLAQKNISIANTDGADFATALVLGSEFNESKQLILEVQRGKLPRTVRLFVDLVDPLLKRRIRVLAERGLAQEVETPHELGRTPVRRPDLLVLNRALTGLLPLAGKGWRVGVHEGREVVFLDAARTVQVPIPAPADRPTLVVVGGVIGRGTPKGVYEVGLVQRQAWGELSGAASIEIRVKG